MWSEFDLDAGIWTIPAARTKIRTAYRIPLSAAAIAQLPCWGQMESGQLVFTRDDGTSLTDKDLSVSMRDIADGRFRDPDTGHPATPHGLRATFRTWATEAGTDREVAEHCLGHLVGNGAERAYKRSDQIEARREVLTDWAAYLGARA